MKRYEVSMEASIIIEANNEIDASVKGKQRIRRMVELMRMNVKELKDEKNNCSMCNEPISEPGLLAFCPECAEKFISSGSDQR